MAFKINIGEKGKTFKLEVDNENLIGKKIGDNITGGEVKKELEGYEFEITGTSDKAGFPGMKDLDIPNLKRVLLEKGFAMKQSRPKGLRLKKTVRGNQITKDIMQINVKIIKSGSKKLEEVFPEQNKPKEKPAEATEIKPEEKKVEVKQEVKA